LEWTNTLLADPGAKDAPSEMIDEVSVVREETAQLLPYGL
jgi:hypothetical protein